MSLPASNNATLQLVPHKAASISGLRGMFRQAGGITGISIASSLVARPPTDAIRAEVSEPG